MSYEGSGFRPDYGSPDSREVDVFIDDTDGEEVLDTVTITEELPAWENLSLEEQKAELKKAWSEVPGLTPVNRNSSLFSVTPDTLAIGNYQDSQGRQVEARVIQLSVGSEFYLVAKSGDPVALQELAKELRSRGIELAEVAERLMP